MASEMNLDEDGDFVMVVDGNKGQDFTTKQDEGAKLSDPEIYEMKVESNIRHRYARTVVTSKVQNLNSMAREATFSVILPDKAFISEFIMVIGGKEYKAYVKEKELAKDIYNEAVASGVAAAHVAVSARESNRFTVSVNVEPLSKATFILTYEELLKRKENMYELIVNIHPKQPIEDLFVNVIIDESRPLKFVKTPSIRGGNEITTSKGDLDPRAEIHQLNPKTAVIKFKPTLERQKELAVNLGTEVNEGLSGQFVVQYDVERDPTGGEVLVQGGYFVHFFAPSDVKPMNKFIIFVLDTSGSMEWRQKMSQLKQAMNAILDQLDTEDYFHIIGFQSVTKVWNIDSPVHSVQTSPSIFGSESLSELQFPAINFPSASLGSPENIKKAKLVLTELYAGGGTNIYEALRVALILIEREKFNTSHKTLPQPIIMFLTDGDPTVGLTDRNVITSKITKLNKDKVPLFSLSFGEDADKSFLKKLSLQNQGFSRHIYEASDAALQLRNFYKEIASPLLSNIKFEYVPETTSLTKTNFPIHFAGSEIIVSGRLNTNAFSCTPKVICISESGPLIFQTTVEKPVSSIERLWAYLTVQQLLDEREIAADKSVNEKKALNLALQYSFVTPVSSLVVVKPNSNDFSIDPEAADKVSRFQPHTGFAFGVNAAQSNFNSAALFSVPRSQGILMKSFSGAALPAQGSASLFDGVQWLQQCSSDSTTPFGGVQQLAQCSAGSASLFGGVQNQCSLGSTSLFGGVQQQYSSGFGTAVSSLDSTAFAAFESASTKRRRSKTVKASVPASTGSFFGTFGSSSSYPLIPGLNTSFINVKLRFRVNTMRDDEKYCVVCFDEIRLEKSFVSVAQVEGPQGLDEDKEEVDRALVFYIRGLLFEWGIPFCYFLSSGTMKANNLKDIITDVIEKLQEIGLNPRVLTCDHSINNRNALSALGASLINTAITINNTTIYTCYDVPHLLKSIRNYFMNTKLQILVNGNEVSWSDIIEVYELNKNSQISQEMQKISDKHVRPTLSQKKRVLFAIQVFSKTVAAAIKSAAQRNQLKSKTANYTAVFVDRMNDIFDVLNSSTNNSIYPQKCALSTSNSVAIKTLQDAEDLFTSIQIYTANKERKYAYSISGFIWTIKSILQLWEALQKENRPCLLTGRLNLNPIESIFSQIEHRNGTFSLPSSEILRSALEESTNKNLNVTIGPTDHETVDISPLGLVGADDQTEEILSDYSEFYE